MSIGYDPFRELDQVAQQLLSGGRSPRSFPMDAYRRGDDFFVHLDLPGVDPGSIDVTVEKNVLTVSAERSWEPQEGEQVVVSERPQGSFTRQLFLGEGLDADRVNARYEAGVLTVTVPVAEQAKPRRVEVSAGGDRQAIDAGSSVS